MVETRRRNPSNLNLQIKVIQQELEDLRQRLEEVENNYTQQETGLLLDLDEEAIPEGNYPF